MSTCVLRRLAFAIVLVVWGGSCANAGSGIATSPKGTPSLPQIGTPSSKPQNVDFPTSTQKPNPAATYLPTSTVTTSEPPLRTHTVAVTLERPGSVATPVAVDQLAAATLTALAPDNESTSFATDTPIPVASPPPQPTAARNHDYVFPIQPTDVASYSAGHHDYPATDIFAPYRASYVAVTDGTIDELSRIDRWDPATNDPAQRGGLYVSLIGDDGVRYYGSHLDEVAPGLGAGTRVKAGTLLGHVGSSGNARGIAPHVHFGISPPTFPGDWEVRRGTVWPFEYLQAWARGEKLTPILP